ncbi:hypothetical protein KM176_05675 [Pseudooceanicola sp. CBS1P-1]|uniref:Uncharacterized protein n=1 Tax=Pseudooceanicola albus TaxID=2692189 RepID=A0A6L7FX47_9RHOB|nr:MULTISPECIES: hypothetical protein [Pseudooceanicola]MBT9383342.1 hypothetical protein [Pseudooceanicola endophyticus]MXN16335.1 hypothetical protein [Pseudooceanicola albus]
MAVDAVQQALNGRFTYRADKGEYWQILGGSGPVYGDCEDYSLTLIWLWEGQSLWRFWWALITLKYVLWYCLAPNGEGHCVTWVRGRGWTDNIQRKIVTDLPEGYRLKLPMLAPLVLLKFLYRRLIGRPGTA